MTAIRLGVRGLRNAPWFSASIVLVLTVGMTLAVVAFAVVEGTLVRPLPYDRPGELFILRASTRATRRSVNDPIHVSSPGDRPDAGRSTRLVARSRERDSSSGE